MGRSLGLALLLAISRASSADAAAREPQTVDRFRQRALDLLRDAVERVHLGKTRLRDIAPKYQAPGPAKLTWKQALAYADKQYANDNLKRAIFLCRHLKRGQPFADVDEVSPFFSSLDGPEGYLISFHSAGQDSFARAIYEQAAHDRMRAWRQDVKRAASEGATGCPRAPEVSPVAQVRGWRRAARHGDILTTPLSFDLRDVAFAGLRFDSMTFDCGGRLLCFGLRRPLPAGKGLLVGGGNIVSVSARAVYYVSVYRTEDDMSEFPAEERVYDASLDLMERSFRPRGWIHFARSEFYINGFLYKRSHYRKEEHPEGLVLRTEHYSPPRPGVIPDGRLDRLLQRPRRYPPDQRCLDVLRACGARGVAAIGRHFPRLTAAAQDNLFDLLADMGSAESVRLVLSLHDAERLGHVERPGQRMGAAWKTVGPHILAALESPQSSLRVRRFAIEVMGHSRDHAVLTLLADTLEDQETCQAAARALRHHASEDALAMLKAALRSRRRHVREAAAAALPRPSRY